MGVERELLIKKENEKEQSTKDICGLWFRGMEVGTPQLQISTQSIAGIDGEFLQAGGRFGATTYKADFFLDAEDEQDLVLAQQKLCQLFYDRKLIRIRDSLEPNKAFWGYSKPTTFQSIHYTQRLFSVELINPAGLRRSIFYSDDEDAKQYFSGFGMNFPYDKEVPYEFSTNHFYVYNASDISIDPLRQRHEFLVALHADGSPTIENKTTRTKISYNGKLKSSDQLTIDGVQVLKNGEYVGRDTDYGFLVLAQGWNEFSITNATIRSVRFHFPFYYF